MTNRVFSRACAAPSAPAGTSTQAKPRRRFWAALLAAPLLLAAGGAWAQSVDVLVNHQALPSATGPAGSTFTYRTITYNNLGNAGNAGSTVSNVVLTEVLPVGVVFQSITAPAGVTCSPTLTAGTAITAGNQTITCPLGTLTGVGVGSAKTVDFSVTIPQPGTNWEADASVTSSGTDQDPSNGQHITRNITTTEAADLGIVFTGPASNSTVTQFAAFNYTAVVTNNGPSAIPAGGSVVTTFTVPTGMTASTPTGSGWSCTPSATTYASAGTVYTCTYTAPAGGIASGAALSTLTIPAKAVTAGTVDSTINVKGYFPGGTTLFPDAVETNNTAQLSVSVVPDNVVDVSLRKTTGRGVIDADSATTFSYSLTATRNSGSDAPTNVTISDTLPSGFALNSATGTGWMCGSSGNPVTVTCTYGGTAPAVGGEYGEVVLNVTAPAGLPLGTITNTGTVSAGNECGTCDSNNQSSVDVTVRDTVNLTVSKTRSQSVVKAGESFTYGIGVTNNGPLAVLSGQTVTVVDNVPQYITINSVTGGWSCPGLPVTGPANLSCTNSSGIAANATSTLTLNATAASTLPSGNYVSITNTADLAGVGGRTPRGTLESSASVNASPLVADIGIVKSVVGANQLESGDTVTYQLVVTNNSTGTGAQRSTGITVTDTLNNLVTSNHGRPKDENGNYVTGTTGPWSAGGFVSSSITFNGNGSGCTNSNNGGTNNGGINGDATSTSRTYTCNGLELDPGASATITLVVKHYVAEADTAASSVAASGNCPAISSPLVTGYGTYTNTATISSSQVRDEVSSNDCGRAQVKVRPLVDLAVFKLATPEQAKAGEPVTYTIHTQNLGPSTAKNVVLTDVLPANAYWIGGAATASNGGSCTGQPANGASTEGATLTCTWASLNNGTQYAVSYKLRSAGTAAEGSTLENAVHVKTDTPETNLDNNDDDATVTLGKPELNVLIDMDHTLDAIDLGTDTEYTITVTNNGPSYATNVHMTDVFPGVLASGGGSVPSSATFSWQDSMTVISNNANTLVQPSQCPEPTLNATSGPLDCVFPVLAPGETVTIKFKMKAESLPDGAQVGTIFHNASVSATEEGLMDPAQNVQDDNTTTDRTSTHVEGVDPGDIESVDLSIDKQGTSSALVNDGDVLKPGDTVTYTLTVKNEEAANSNLVSTNGVVTDVLPTGLTFAGASGECTYATATRTVSCAVGTLNPQESRAFIITVTVDTPYKGARPLVNRARVKGLGDYNPSNDEDEKELPMEPPPPATPIPTLSQWGLMLLSLLLAGFALRRRRV